MPRRPIDISNRTRLADDDGFTLIELLVVILIRDPLVARRRGGAVDRA